MATTDDLYNPYMTEAGNAGGEPNALGRIFRWQPHNYRQAWLAAAIGQAMPWLIVFSIFGTMDRWHSPWPVLCLESTAIVLVGGGLTHSYVLHMRRRKQARALPH